MSNSVARQIESNLVGVLTDVMPTGFKIVQGGNSNEGLQTPYLVVNCNTIGRPIESQNTGKLPQEVDCNLNLYTTAGDGENATSDEDLLDLDLRIEKAFFLPAAKDVKDSIQDKGDSVKLYSFLNPNSAATEFDDIKRNIEYNFQIHARDNTEPVTT